MLVASYPHDVVVDYTSGIVYVADYGDKLVSALDLNLTYSITLIGSPLMKGPAGLALDPEAGFVNI